MNKLLYQLSSDYHLSFKQKILQICLQIFGHEALIDVAQLRNNSHCQVFDIDIYRLASIENQLAYRKLLNPFKWVEWCLAIVLEGIPWVFYKTNKFLNNKLKKQNNVFIYFLGESLRLIVETLGFTLNIVSHALLELARILLAPVRNIIRPSLELLQTHTEIFLTLLSFTVLMSAALAFTFFTAGVASSFLLSLIPTWIIALKAATNFLEVKSAFQKIADYRPSDQQEIKQFLSGSTYKMTELLHGINPKLTVINKANEQTAAHTLALFTGTESLFYKPIPTKSKQVNSKKIPYSQFTLYQEYKTLHSFDSTTRHPNNFLPQMLYIQKVNDDIEYVTLTKMQGQVHERYQGIIAKTELQPETLKALFPVLTPGSDQLLDLPYIIQKDVLTAYINHRHSTEQQQKTTASLRP